MGKEFVEYNEKTLHCSTSTVCYCLTNYAKDYIKNPKVPQHTVERVRIFVVICSKF